MKADATLSDEVDRYHRRKINKGKSTGDARIPLFDHTNMAKWPPLSLMAQKKKQLNVRKISNEENPQFQIKNAK